MQELIIAFLTGGAFIGTISFFIGRMLYKSDVVGMCEKNCKLVLDAKNEIKEVRDDRNNKLSSILNKVNEL